MDPEVRQIFLNEKPASALVTLMRKGEQHVRSVSQEIDATYSHTLRLLERMEGKGLVESEESGRKREYRLTREGKSLATNFTDFFGPADRSSVESFPSTISASDRRGGEV